MPEILAPDKISLIQKIPHVVPQLPSPVIFPIQESAFIDQAAGGRLVQLPVSAVLAFVELTVIQQGLRLGIGQLPLPLVQAVHKGPVIDYQNLIVVIELPFPVVDVGLEAAVIHNVPFPGRHLSQAFLLSLDKGSLIHQSAVLIEQGSLALIQALVKAAVIHKLLFVVKLSLSLVLALGKFPFIDYLTFGVIGGPASFFLSFHKTAVISQRSILVELPFSLVLVFHKVSLIGRLAFLAVEGSLAALLSVYKVSLIGQRAVLVELPFSLVLAVRIDRSFIDHISLLVGEDYLLEKRLPVLEGSRGHHISLFIIKSSLSLHLALDKGSHIFLLAAGEIKGAVPLIQPVFKISFIFQVALLVIEGSPSFVLV